MAKYPGIIFCKDCGERLIHFRPKIQQNNGLSAREVQEMLQGAGESYERLVDELRRFDSRNT